MTARQIIEEIRKLPPEEQEEVRAEIEKTASNGGVRYADFPKAMVVADRIFAEHGELFRKLAE